MARDYLKKATLTAQSDASNVHDIVRGILNDIEDGGDAKALDAEAARDNTQMLLIKHAESNFRLRRITGNLKECAIGQRQKKREETIMV